MRLTIGQNHVAMTSGPSAPQESARRRTDVMATCQRIIGGILPGAWAGPVDVVGPPAPLPTSSFGRSSWRRRGRVPGGVDVPGPGGPSRGPFGGGAGPSGGFTGGGVPSAPSPGVGLGGGSTGGS